MVCGVVPSVIVNSEPELTRQVEQSMSPAAERVIGPVAETATVPVASGNVIVLVPVGLA